MREMHPLPQIGAFWEETLMGLCVVLVVFGLELVGVVMLLML